jgi:hypothetical protein
LPDVSRMGIFVCRIKKQSDSLNKSDGFPHFLISGWPK